MRLKFLFLFGFFVLLFWFFVIGFHFRPLDTSQTQNAVWIEHRFVEDFVSENEILQLVRTLEDHGIRYAFLHSGPFETDGTIPSSRYKAARRFLQLAKQISPKIQWHAWLGQKRSLLTLDQEETRSNIVEQVALLTQLVGFDGVHFDIEPLKKQDEPFLQLLNAARTLLKDTKEISVAVDEWQPQWLSRILSFDSFIAGSFLKKVAQFSDLIVIMTYDSKITHPRLYSWWVEQQLVYSTGLIRDTSARILIGIPLYKEASEYFNPQAENIVTGIKGVIWGIRNIRSTSQSFSGVALYPYWTMTQEDWRHYDTLWKN